MEHILAREAPPDNQTCSSCSVADGGWRCSSCFGNPIFCWACCWEAHRRLPFHRVEKWTGAYFTPDWLSNVGVKLHLGHGGLECPSSRTPLFPSDPEASEPDPDSDADEEDWGPDENLIPQSFPTPPQSFDRFRETAMVVVDSSGIHNIVVTWCTCPGSHRPDLQLLDIGLYPATFKQPRTAFTFPVLDEFLIDNLECKTACFNFYGKLRRFTSGAFPHTVPVGFHLIYETDS
jgi:hypothetical protein